MKGKNYKLPIEYSTKKVTPFGGMRLLKDFVDKLDIMSILDQLNLPEPKSNRGYSPQHIISGFWLSIWTGASRFIHADWLRYDEVLQKIFGFKSLPSQSTYSRFFHKFSWKRNEEVFPKAQRNFFQYVKSENITVDLDSTVVTRFGNQEGARKGYNPTKPGRNSHHPLMAFVPQFKLVANAWLRPGNTADINGFELFLEETFNQVLVDHSIGLVRADSGFYSDGSMNYLESKSLNYILAVKFYKPLKLKALSANDWCEIDDGIEFTTIKHQVAGGKKRNYVLIRQSIRRRPKAGGKMIQLELPFAFDDKGTVDYRYSCYVTNLDLSGDEVWRLYRGRADAENRIKELKYDFGMDHFCLSKFWATEAAFRFILMAYNIISLFRHLALQSSKASTLKTIKFYCFALGAWTSTHSKKTVLKISLPAKRRAWMDGIFLQISGLSPPFQISNA